jgi:quercetin dioxygenase-like cupin family protein
LDRTRPETASGRGGRLIGSSTSRLRLGAVAVAGALAAFAGGGPARANGSVETEEARIARILQSALVEHGGEVNRCFEKALADTLDVAGKVELAVDVGDEGQVTKASPELDEVKSPILLACLQQSAETWTLAGIDAGSTVIVPLAFEGQVAQFSIKASDAPDRGPPAPGRKRSPGARRPRPSAPFSVKLLVDEATMRARQASLSLLTVSPANRIAMHRHPGAEILYVTDGHARILGPAGVSPEKLDQGSAVFIPAGMPHAIENMGRSSPAVMLEVFAPLGPEKVYRDPKDPAGRAAFEVIRDPRKVHVPEGAALKVASAARTPSHAIAGGKGHVRILFDEETTGSDAVSLGILEVASGTEIPRHTHDGSAEILYVLSGGGELTIGSEKIPFSADQAIQIPEDQPHAVRFSGGEKTVMVQIYAPAGPEQRFKVATAKGK